MPPDPLAVRQPAPWRFAAESLLLLVAIVWGTSYGVAKQALLFYPVLGFIALRFALTFMLLLPVVVHEGRAALRAGIPMGGLLLAIFLCETYGLALTQASHAAFLISLCVIFTPFAEWLCFRQRPENAAFAAAALSLAGAALLTQGTGVHLNGGDLLMLAAAVLRAAMVCLTKSLTRRSSASSLALTAVQSGVVCGGTTLLLLLQPGSLPALPDAPSFWLATAYLVLFCTLFAFAAQTYAIRRTTPTRAALLMGSEPLFGALFATVWLGENLGLTAWAGGLLIVAASVWAVLPRRR